MEILFWKKGLQRQKPIFRQRVSPSENCKMIIYKSHLRYIYIYFFFRKHDQINPKHLLDWDKKKNHPHTRTTVAVKPISTIRSQSPALCFTSQTSISSDLSNLSPTEARPSPCSSHWPPSLQSPISSSSPWSIASVSLRQTYSLLLNQPENHFTWSRCQWEQIRLWHKCEERSEPNCFANIPCPPAEKTPLQYKENGIT